MTVSGSSPLRPEPSKDLKRCLSPANFRLAWERLLRAGDPIFKWYWRPSAAIASTIAPKILTRLRDEIKNGTFHPDHGCLFSEPKPTGLLRHWSLLSIGDLIVYQAIVNVIADHLYPCVRSRYGVSVFGNIYSGPKNKFFMRDWRRSYQGFNNANRASFYSGFTWLAQFDFASFYDSIGHHTLSTILQEQYAVGADLCTLLSRYLNKWSNASYGDSKKLPRLYLEHGIPQGPLPSVLLSEVMLSYIDEQMLKVKNVKYLRYADDIRIWGSDEGSVRYATAILDRLARNIGLYPQSKKFDIEEVEDVETILKTVSIPRDISEPDDSSFALLKDELKEQPPLRLLWDMLRQFAETGRVEDVTQFKFLLGTTEATTSIAETLCVLIRTGPELTETCCYYIERCEQPSSKLITLLIGLVEAYPGYPWMSGRILRTIWGYYKHLSKSQTLDMKKVVNRATDRKGIRSDCQLQGITRVMRVGMKSISHIDIENWADNPMCPWWSIVYFILNVRPEQYDEVAFTGLLGRFLIHSNQEVCRAAAYQLCLLGQPMPNQPMDSRGECKAIFQKYGLAKRTRSGSSRINHLLRELIDKSLKFGTNIQRASKCVAEHQANLTDADKKAGK